MDDDQMVQLENCRLDPVCFLPGRDIRIDVLRLDLVHPVISGNKWFKLKEYLSEAISLGKKTIVSFGGAYSNHIVATAAAARQAGLESIGMIRGEEPPALSPTLVEAKNFGMELFFVSREDYRNRIIPVAVYRAHRDGDVYVINEGGYGRRGTDGAKKILDLVNAAQYEHITAAVGTGTTLAGLVEATAGAQKITGISVLKNNHSLEKEIQNLLSEKNKDRFTLLHDYHFGGYAKYSGELIESMNQWYRETGIPSDFVYTGKLFFALTDLLQKGFFQPGSRVLTIHSGGLQGNRSLPKGTLIF